MWYHGALSIVLVVLFTAVTPQLSLAQELDTAMAWVTTQSTHLNLNPASAEEPILCRKDPITNPPVGYRQLSLGAGGTVAMQISGEAWRSCRNQPQEWRSISPFADQEAIRARALDRMVVTGVMFALLASTGEIEDPSVPGGDIITIGFGVGFVYYLVQYLSAG